VELIINHLKILRMKRLVLSIIAVIAVSALMGQSLEEIVKKHSAAMKSDDLAKINTARITGKVAQMGMEMPLIMTMKRPDKVRVSTSMNGMEIIQVFDGAKGYMLNPFSGSTEMVEIPAEQAKQIEKNNMFVNQLARSLDEGGLELIGEQEVDGQKTFKIKVSIEGVDDAFYFISKETYLPVMTSITMEAMGQKMDVEIYTMEFTNFNGMFLPKRTVTYSGGMEVASMIYEKVEVNIPIDDSLFTKK